MSKAQELRKQAKAHALNARTELQKENPDQDFVTAEMDQAKALKAQAETLDATNDFLGDLNTPQPPAELPVEGSAETIIPEDHPIDDGQEVQLSKAIHVVRYGDLDEAEGKIAKEIYGTDYGNLNDAQFKAFITYLRTGRVAPILQRQVWSLGNVKSMLKHGMSVGEVKATMIEGQDALGGYAVPVEVGDRIIARSAGLAAVRSGGAIVVQTSSKAIEWLRIDGGNDRYPSALRGSWGAEAKNPPDESNWTFGLVTIPVNIYTYKVPFSVSLLEDATNMVEIFEGLVSDTLGMDEDDAFIVGDGVGKPLGILPGSANTTRSLNNVNSGSASTLTMNGLKNLRRGIASQYRMNGRATWIANGDTGGVIETLQDGENRYYVDALEIGDTFLGGVWRESEAMPDIAGSAVPLVYGDMSGYLIVERLGLSIRRYNDAYTGINTVQFHVRRRIGGDLVEPWKFTVQTIST